MSVGATSKWGLRDLISSSRSTTCSSTKPATFVYAIAVAVGTAAEEPDYLHRGTELSLPSRFRRIVLAERVGSLPSSSFLGEYATIPKGFGVLLNASWRMHPSICDWVSAAVCQRRLNREGISPTSASGSSRPPASPAERPGVPQAFFTCPSFTLAMCSCE